MSPSGKTVYVVGAGDKVSTKPVKVIYDYQGLSVVDGIAAGDRIVVEGKQNLRPGGKIRETKPSAIQPTNPSTPETK
jgi:multidrug efflux pump subunit AcrA (membrane-fusion protein)